MVILGLCLSFNSMANEDKKDKALDAAEIWLMLIDEGQYSDSWETTAVYFKKSIEKEKWEQMITAVREPLGRQIHRELKSKTYHTSLPGVPDGEYIIIQFITSFENKKSGIETVTLMADRNGKSRVSGYYIK